MIPLVIIGAGILLVAGLVKQGAMGPIRAIRWPPQAGDPGYVTLGGQPAPQGDWSPGNLQTTQQAGQYAGEAIGAATGIAAATGHAGIFAASTALGAATIGVGIAIGVVITIVGVIAKHHQEALAREGKALNAADPNLYNQFVLTAQAALQGEITSQGQADKLIDQHVTDWYGEVRPIQHGTWHFTGQDMSADYNKIWIKRTHGPAKGAPGYNDYHAPDPCNAACVIGHFFAERGALLTKQAVKDILSGKHGTFDLPVIPAHDTQTGFPEVQMIY